jgi:hypothetical protein
VSFQHLKLTSHQIQRWGDIQWHDIHTKCNENPLIYSKVVRGNIYVDRQTDRHMEMMLAQACLLYKIKNRLKIMQIIRKYNLTIISV